MTGPSFTKFELHSRAEDVNFYADVEPWALKRGNQEGRAAALRREGRPILRVRNE